MFGHWWMLSRQEDGRHIMFCIRCYRAERLKFKKK
jgi:hypothetical protein